jgi:hypothetical protein
MNAMERFSIRMPLEEIGDGDRIEEQETPSI